MFRYLTIFAFSCAALAGAPKAAEAKGAVSSTGDTLIFDRALTNPSPGYRGYTLCQVAEYMDLFYLPVYIQPKSYALSTQECTGMSYKPVDSAILRELKVKGMVPADLPETPELSLKWKVFGHAVPIFALVGGVLKVLQVLIHGRSGKRRRRKVSDELAFNLLAAMAGVAVSDGHIDAREAEVIAAQFKALTGRTVKTENVLALLHDTQSNGTDLDAIGDGLRDKDRKLVMHAALSTAVADGRIEESEYSLVSQIAHRLNISGDDFRKMLQMAKRDLGIA